MRRRLLNYRARVRRILSIATWLILLLTMSGCRNANNEERKQLVVDAVWPRERSGVFLNEAIVVHFSADVERTSVTSGSFLVRRVEDGRPAQGLLSVDGPRVRFDPVIPRSRSLEDAGLLPGTRYEVIVKGYPHLDGVRSSFGDPLSQTTRWVFETAERTDPPSQLFDDLSPAFGAQLRLTSALITPEDALLLVCDEPLDPTTLVDGDFTLNLVMEEGPIDVTPVWLRLLENEHPSGARAGVAVIEVRPRKSLSVGTYLLRPDEDLHLRDFAGNRVWLPPVPSSAQGFVLEVREGDGDLATQSMELDFLDTSLRSPIGVPGMDGTATWSGDGTVRLRIPAACGSGIEGELSLEGDVDIDDLNSLRLNVPKGVRTGLTAPGLIVLRSQGSLRIDGVLERRGNGAAVFDDPSALTVSQWLARAKSAEREWTVLVAGGDIIVSGEVLMDGPLALIAGGRIRIVGEVKAPAGRLWLVGEGGGLSVDSLALHPSLRIDEPLNNPLAGPLTFAVLSSPLPPWGGVDRWLGASGSGRNGVGAWRVLFLPQDLEISGAQVRGDSFDPKDDPRLLPPKGGLRLLIQVSALPPSGVGVEPWVSPVVDRAELRWERIRLEEKPR